MKEISITDKIPVRGKYDIIAAGGGVAGVAAAVAAARAGKKVLLLEKTITLGGLATTGLINLFVPMCNGRGVQIIKGMAEEFLRLSIKYGYDTIPQEWKNGNPGNDAKTRYCTRFSPAIFSLALTELVKNEGIDILYDTVVSEPIMDGSHCKGLVVENKSGREFYEADIIIDVTGDADILYRAGVPTKQGKNYFTMLALRASLKSCEDSIRLNDITKLIDYQTGGPANLYGGNHPEGMPFFKGTDVNDVTDFVVKNHLKMLDNIRSEKRTGRDVVMLPAMAQFRTTRTLIGDSVFSKESAYSHCETSIGAICDFDHRDYLFEIPFGTLVKTGYDNFITAGRTASAETDYSWDILRVIPPAIITGQAAGIAASMAIDAKKPIYDIDVHALQSELERQNVMIHFDDSLIPTEERTDEKFEYGHF